MTKLLRPATKEDVYSLQTRLRDADVEELAAQGQDPTSALMQGLWRSKPECMTAVIDDLPVGMYGVCPGLCDRFGAVWLLGSEEMVQHSHWFLRTAKGELERLSRGYDLLYNQVHDQNEVHIKWLRWMGFEFTRHNPPFLEFSMVTKHV